MAKIKWKNKSDIDKEKLEIEEKKKHKKYKGKPFKNLSTKDKDELLEMLARQFGLID